MAPGKTKNDPANQAMGNTEFFGQLPMRDATFSIYLSNQEHLLVI